LTPGEDFYAQFGVPWRPDDPHARFRTMPAAELHAFHAQDDGAPPGTLFARFNGSPLFPTRMADLRGVRDKKYLDSTGTHRNRGPADIARYGILVEFADAAVFGPHHLLPTDAEHVAVRPPDAAMYAMALFLDSLDPAPSPHAVDDEARRGQQVFTEQGCAACHAPPLYTSNKLLPVTGYEPSAELVARLGDDLSPRHIDTDPGLALLTRKGTGCYRVPTLRGLWYRGLYGHSGFVTSLEDWFDARRLQPDYVPSGFRGPGVAHRAVPGHEFGLDLSAEDKRALIAFLQTL
jgi:mono/diheme cytochrome c family protein